MSSSITVFPPELFTLICSYIYYAGVQPADASLDPHSETQISSPPTSLPSSYPNAHWHEPQVRHTLAQLSLVNRAWYDAAKPWLWKKVEVRLPRDWLALVDEIAGEDEDIDVVQEANYVGQTIEQAAKAAAVTSALIQEQSPFDLAKELHEKLLATLTVPDSSIPPDLLSPPATRDPSPRRLRPKSKSPARWKLMRSISDAVQNVMNLDHPGLYVPLPHDPRPGRYIQHLDFNHFRTIGMRRSIEEGVNNRYVTGERLQAVLKEMPNLLAFGATEYMDGALTLPVLQELLLRGSSCRGRGRPSRGRDIVIIDPNDPDQDDRERRRDCRELEALDLTGCVSGVFVRALTDFVTQRLIASSEPDASDDEDASSIPRGRRRRAADEESISFPGLQRLGLRGVKSIHAPILNPFVLSFPSLTHLDLSCTRVTPELLEALGSSNTVHLESLGLERCSWLTGESIRNFLVDAPCTYGLRQLSLYGDFTFPSALSEQQLRDVFELAPSFRSGKLIYLDLSSSPVTKDMLVDLCAYQPSLRSLGLSYIRQLSLSAVAQFLTTKAPHVEVLTLAMTSPELGYGDQYVNSRQASIALHAHIIRPLCTPPFSFSLSASPAKKLKPPTRLRVVELASALLAGLGMGADSWRILKSKGGRGWYVDTASGWITETTGSGEGEEHVDMYRRDLPKDHAWRMELERLANANGNVSSAVGWHARKVEILHGNGLLGRESGLYGAVSFAYQG